MANAPETRNSKTPRDRPPAGLTPSPRGLAEVRKAIEQQKPQLDALCHACFGSETPAEKLVGNLFHVASYVIGAEGAHRSKAVIREANAGITAARRLRQVFSRLDGRDCALAFHDNPDKAFTRDPASGTMRDAAERYENFARLLQRAEAGLAYLAIEAAREPANRSTPVDPARWLVEAQLAFWRANTEREPTSGKGPSSFEVFVQKSWDIVVAATGMSPRAVGRTTLHNMVVEQLRAGRDAPRGRGRPAGRGKAS